MIDIVYALQCRLSAGHGLTPTIDRALMRDALEEVERLREVVNRLTIRLEGHFCDAKVAGIIDQVVENTIAEKESMNELGEKIRQINRQNGWNVTTKGDWNLPYKIPAILALIHSEVSEALEAFRHNDTENFSEELADIIIRVLDCAPGLGIDIDSAVEKKLAKNKTRGFRHGGKRI